jgi:hypothetical protein
MIQAAGAIREACLACREKGRSSLYREETWTREAFPSGILRKNERRLVPSGGL